MNHSTPIIYHDIQFVTSSNTSQRQFLYTKCPIKMSKNRRYFCRWDECKDYCNHILDKAPSDHSWSRKMIRLRFTPNKTNEYHDKATALRVSVRKHLLDNDPNYRIANQLHIYPHNYPLAVLQWRN